MIRARVWEYRDPPENESAADQILRLACLNYSSDEPTGPARAGAVLRDNPTLPATDLAVAAVAGSVESVRELLSANSPSASTPTGPFGWSPLMYLTYGRLPVERDAALTTAELLLDAGADPNDGRYFGGLPPPFTALTGVLGGGENDQPAHPHAIDLGRLLLSRGADPNDAQTLYNRMFSTDDDAFELLFEFGLGTGDGGPWRAASPEVAASPTQLVRGLLEWAVTHDQRARVAMLHRHGVDVLSPLATGARPIEVAVHNGHRQLAALLVDAGAQMPPLDPVQTFIAAALAGDAAAVHATPDAVVAAARRTRPSLVVWAAGHGRVDAVDLLVAAGFDIDALGRADIATEQPWQTALHTAVERDDAAMVARLLALGADTTIRDQRFDSTATQWVTHLGHVDLAPLFE